jgi:hypothetical protein
MQEILNRLGLSVAYKTVDEKVEDSLRSRVVAYATVTRTGTNQVIAELQTLNLGQIEIVAERFLDAFAQGYDLGYRDGRADLLIEQHDRGGN